jgi:hypothetical protein
VRGLAAVVGFLVFVELASGILQGYYTPIFSDIADHLGGECAVSVAPFSALARRYGDDLAIAPVEQQECLR